MLSPFLPTDLIVVTNDRVLLLTRNLDVRAKRQTREAHPSAHGQGTSEGNQNLSR